MGKPNHFASVCRSSAKKSAREPVSRKLKPKTVRPLQKNDNQHSDSDSDESYLYTVNNPNKNNANVKVTIAGVSLMLHDLFLFILTSMLIRDRRGRKGN